MKWLLVALLVACHGASAIDGMLERAPAAPRSSTPVAHAIASPSFEVPAPRDPIIGFGRGKHACVVRRSGHVDCWGTWVAASRADPQVHRVPGLTDAVAIDPRAECVLRANGEMACFEARLTLGKVADGVAALGDGDGGCYIRTDGSVQCKQRIAGVGDAASVTRSGSTVCIVRRSGEVACATDDDRTRARATPLPIGKVRRLAILEHSGCAIREDGSPTCFAFTIADDGTVGVRAAGQPPDDGREQPGLEAIDVAQLAGATELVVRSSTTYDGAPEVDALIAGEVVHLTVGQPPHVLASLQDATQLGARCALRAQGSVVCWGSNAGGVLGQPTTIGRERRPPSPVRGVENVVAIAVTQGESWALLDDGDVLHWGRGTARPTPLELPPAMPRARAIAVGARVKCLLANHTAWCSRDSAELVSALELVREIAVHRDHVMALRDDGRLVEITMTPEEPTKQWPYAPRDVVSLVGGRPACALTRTGAVHCLTTNNWNRAGSLDGVTAAASAEYLTCGLRLGALECWRDRFGEGWERATDVPAITDGAAIAMQGGLSCVVRTTGAVACWHPRAPDSLVEVLRGGAAAVAIAPMALYSSDVVTSSPHACALVTDRTVTCWGSNREGELGDGSIGHSDVPLGVPGL